MRRYWVLSEAMLDDEVKSMHVMLLPNSFEVVLWKDAKQKIEQLQERIKQLEADKASLHTEEGD